MTRKPAALSALLALTALTSQMALAQTPPSPGQVQDTLRPPPATMPPPEVPEFQTPARAPTQVPSGGTPVPVQRFVLTGNTLLDEAELRGILARYEGRVHTLEEIYAIADYLTELYRFHGYSLAHVVVPAQRIDQGEVTLRAIEGRISALRVEGNARYETATITDRMTSMMAGNTFRADDLQRELIRLNDLPGLDARAVIRPGDEFGTSEVVLRVTEDPSAYGLAVDNHGRDTIGAWRATADATWNSPRGIGDQLSLSGLVSESALLTYVSGGYNFPIGIRGDRLAFSFSHAVYEVGGAVFVPLDIDGKTTNFRVEFSRPVIRTRASTLLLGAALSYNMADVNALGAPISDSRLGLLEFTANWAHIAPNGIASSVTGTLGTNFRSNPTGARDNAQKYRLRADGSVSVPLGEMTVLLVRGGASYSPDPLADSQQFSIGGPHVLRGYQSADARGDFGSYVGVEALHTLPIGSMATTLGLFVEAGQAKRRVRPGDAPGTVYSDSRRDYGLSLSVAPGAGMNLNMSWARPFSGYPGSDGTTDDQFWLTFRADF